LPIDAFLRSLAKDVGDHAVAVILSGTGSDGSQGVRSVKASGGVVFVQDETTAKFDGMPVAAISTGAADVVAPPAEIARRLTTYLKDPADAFPIPPELTGEPFRDVVSMIKRERGVDLHHYRERTLQRRLMRRMGIMQITEVRDYVNLLQKSASELDNLLQDLLIGVTEFFRDREAFEVLKADLPNLLVMAGTDTLRVWVAGCSSGEEVYTLAMLFQEEFTRAGRNADFRIFGTDVNAQALARASAGVYPSSIQNTIDAERMEAFFEPVEDGFRVRRALRDKVVFAQHNVSKDPPFTRMHLVTCRNMLIYVTPEAQGEVVRLLHFALVRNGRLMLGPSESLGDLSAEFDPIDPKWRLFRKKRDARLPRTPMTPPVLRPIAATRSHKVGVHPAYDFDQVASTLVALLGSSCVIVNSAGVVQHVLGDISPFVTMPSGRASLDFLRMLNPAGRTAVSTAMHGARKSGQCVKYHDIRFGTNANAPACDVTVSFIRPEQPDGSDLYAIIFGEPTQSIEQPAHRGGAVEQDLHRIQHLEDELQHTKENLQATIEELETTNEELQSSNEELVASNEELQSTNEEMHSVNEELYTVNAEHASKIEELSELTRDIENLLRSTGVGTIFLDADLNIRKYTPLVAEVVPIMATDVGRPIQHLATTLRGINLETLAQEVLATGKIVEREVSDRHRVSRLVRMQPYEVEGRRLGVVVTFVDLTKVKDAQRNQAETEARFQRMVEHLDQVFWMLPVDASKFTYISPLFEELWGIDIERVYDDPDAWIEAVHLDDRPTARKLLDKDCAAEGFGSECRLVLPDGGVRWIQAKASLVLSNDGEPVAIVGSARDVTDQVEQELQLKKLAEQLENEAQRDALTGIVNRRGLEHLLTRELARAHRSGARIAAILVDADDFKSVNDSLGHAAGDTVLQGMCSRMLDVLRPSDVLSRVGGDEFLALLPETRLAEAVSVAERLRLAIADNPLTIGGKPVTATASLGVAAITDEIISIEEILNATRQALAECKRTGKNRVVAATDGDGRRCRQVASGDDFAKFAEEGKIEPFTQRIHDLV
ncbi:MAG: diguanylate cyclase, partial [Planctomycetes bacterium]|nr:diguanylate cyclase [Planctomycetota bacterium]